MEKTFIESENFTYDDREDAIYFLDVSHEVKCGGYINILFKPSTLSRITSRNVENIYFNLDADGPFIEDEHMFPVLELLDENGNCLARIPYIKGCEDSKLNILYYGDVKKIRLKLRCCLMCCENTWNVRLFKVQINYF